MYTQPNYNQMFPYPQQTRLNRRYIMMQVQPVINYGLREAQYTGLEHAMTEVALISYLMGRGYDYQSAYRMVEQWEQNEEFPMYGMNY